MHYLLGFYQLSTSWKTMHINILLTVLVLVYSNNSADCCKGLIHGLRKGADLAGKHGGRVAKVTDYTLTAGLIFHCDIFNLYSLFIIILGSIGYTIYFGWRDVYGNYTRLPAEYRRLDGLLVEYQNTGRELKEDAFSFQSAVFWKVLPALLFFVVLTLITISVSCYIISQDLSKLRELQLELENGSKEGSEI